jgi:hypothetical protein
MNYMTNDALIDEIVEILCQYNGGHHATARKILDLFDSTVRVRSPEMKGFTTATSNDGLRIDEGEQ